MPVLRVAHLQFSHQFRKRLGPVRQQDEMDVIGHEAICEEVQPMEFGILLKQPEVNVSIGGCEEDVASFVPSLGDMMGALWHDHAGKPGHIGLVST